MASRFELHLETKRGNTARVRELLRDGAEINGVDPAGYTPLMYALRTPAGRGQDARRLLRELDERASRGEYVAAFARVYIHTGLNDLPAVRRTFAEAVEDRVVLFLGYAISQFRMRFATTRRFSGCSCRSDAAEPREMSSC